MVCLKIVSSFSPKETGMNGIEEKPDLGTFLVIQVKSVTAVSACKVYVLVRK
jgi:hypothetical protein